MCFSAGASFGAAAVLTGIGIASIKKTQDRHQLPFAAVPLIFAAQQLCEGFLWLALMHSKWAFLQWPMTYVFLFFAQVLWPFWVPYSVLQFESSSDRKHKRLERIFLAAGLLVSTYLGYCLLLFHVEARIQGHHIVYDQNYPQGISMVIAVLYFVAVVLPPFFSGVKRMWSLGTAIFLSYGITAIFYRDYLVSVWCFFAAIISITILGLVISVNREAGKPASLVHH